MIQPLKTKPEIDYDTGSNNDDDDGSGGSGGGNYP